MHLVHHSVSPKFFMHFFLLLFACIPQFSRAKVLIIHDELPQMEVLTNFLMAKGNLKVEIVEQDKLPQDLSSYQAVIVYIHHKLFESTELAIIEYAKSGGRLVLLHHSISSGKAANNFYFDFLGIQLDGLKKSKFPVELGAGYGWVAPITLTMVNLNPMHYITNFNIDWDAEIVYTSSDWPSAERKYPAITLEHTEVYMNHKFTDGREKTVLIGFKFYDERNKKLFLQDRAAWIKKTGKGEVVYFMPGHSKLDYENKNISQWVLNAVMWENN